MLQICANTNALQCNFGAKCIAIGFANLLQKCYKTNIAKHCKKAARHNTTSFNVWQGLYWTYSRVSWTDGYHYYWRSHGDSHHPYFQIQLQECKVSNFSLLYFPILLLSKYHDSSEREDIVQKRSLCQLSMCLSSVPTSCISSPQRGHCKTCASSTVIKNLCKCQKNANW